MTANPKIQLSFDFENHSEAPTRLPPPAASAVLLDLQQIRAQKKQQSEKDEERLLLQAIKQSVAHLM
jgi:hypothetical protein